MSEEDDVTVNLKGLDQVIKALKVKASAKIGIFGGGGREGSSVSNAQIGFWHEYGTTKMPKRSFLREPIAEYLDKKLEGSGAFDKEVLEQVVAQGTIIPWLKKVAILAEEIVAEGFATGGYGKWAPLKHSTLARKKVLQILVETQQLRNSITTEVKEG